MVTDNQRSARARQTRRRVLEAAGAAFQELGYANTTIRTVALRAAVSPETIYKAFRNKATLLKDFYDLTVAGDDNAVPISDRPEARAVRDATTPTSAANAYARLARIISSRTGPLLRIVYGASGTADDLRDFVRRTDEERLVGTTMVVQHWHSQGWLQPTLGSARARDILWTLNAPSVYLAMQDRGWSDDDYEAWLAELLPATLLTT
ncbi:TetR/AcrR family transcriptional regulator [Dactylosporangium matsuzakiense]|uniref:TetR family transcriptional regulator n=1 Tax=Dactylosporangium matsuzakiense TaxID=53360 RepID=A0A9W6KNU2_9ACTN|nr:TetR family transcriptional regulator [Dactylosporangium matsuzakiense]UWZ48369.1 TetR family transcriptional regulator [Dactylosporangium matsuzakiense]GLL05476.1 TetR family transcriptional regulator [Dactylosporangium matsuzakiense]